MKAVLNVGGGTKSIAISAHFAPWKHDLLDIDPKGNPEIVCDARDMFSLPAASYDAIYCSHNLEHFHRHDVKKVLKGFFHVLKPEGFVEAHVPDIGWVIRTVAERRLDIDDVLYQSPSGPILVRDVFYGYHVEIERSGHDFYAHKTGFTPPALVREMTQAGFVASATFSRSMFEVSGYFFKQAPTTELMTLLKIPQHA